MPEPVPADIFAHVATLFDAPLTSLQNIHGGRNSRVFKASTADGKKWLVKEYFHTLSTACDQRDRLETEWRACTFLHAHGLDCVPQALRCAPEKRMAVYQYIEGIPPSFGEPGSSQEATLLAAFGDFWARLYALRHAAVRECMPPAADACFCLESLEQHLRNRCAKLLAVPPVTALHRDMHTLVQECVMLLGQSSTKRAQNLLHRAGVQQGDVLPVALRMPSPSDFGTHNALQNQDGRIFFVDFEYFGMDDPVKLLADTCLHPAMNLTKERQAYLLQRMSSLAHNAGDSHFVPRFLALAPLWRCVWCCIVLNVFVPQNDVRRIFAQGLQAREAQENVLLERLTRARVLAGEDEHEYQNWLLCT